EPAGRHRLRAGQPAAARLTMATLTATDIATAETQQVESPARRAWRRLKRRKGAMFGLVVICIFILLALLAPRVAPYDPIQQSGSAVRMGPSAAPWLGTDEVGRDLLSRVIFGARASLSAGIISVGIALCVGVPLGIVAGYIGGWVDALISRLTDAMLATPFLI